MSPEVIPVESIHVCPLSAIDNSAKLVGAGHLITLINAEIMGSIDTPAPIAPDRHLRLAMNDATEPLPGLILPNEDHVSDLIDFTVSWDRRAPILIHCYAGISRSTAAAFVALCILNPHVEEARIASELRRVSPTAQPNPLLVEIADRLIGRNGRMLAAINAIGPGIPAVEAKPFWISALL